MDVLHNVNMKIMKKRFIIALLSLTDFEITKSVDPSLDKEALRVVKSMPKMESGKEGWAICKCKNLQCL